MLGCAFLAGVIGYMYGSINEITPVTPGIAASATLLGVTDIPAFVRVGYIHNAGYLGGLIGLIVAIITLRRKVHSHLPSGRTPALAESHRARQRVIRAGRSNHVPASAIATWIGWRDCG
jgi:hypothetical protein